MVNEGDAHRGSLSSGSEGNRLRTSTSDSLGRERASTSSTGRYRANSRMIAEAMATNRDSFGATAAGSGITASGVSSGRFRSASKALTERDSLGSLNSKSINLEFIRRDSEPASAGIAASSSGDIEQGAEGTIISPLQQQQQNLSTGPSAAVSGGQRTSAGRAFTFSLNWNSGISSAVTPGTPLVNPVKADHQGSASPPEYQNEHLVRYLEADTLDIAARLAEAMTNKTGGGVSLSQKHSHEPRSRNNSLRWTSSNSYRLPRLPSLPGGGGGFAVTSSQDSRVPVPPPPSSSSAAVVPATPTAEPRYFNAAPSSVPSTPRIRSATAVLLSKDMGFGLGPNPALGLNRNKEGGAGGGGGGGGGSSTVTTTVTPGGGASSAAAGGVRTYSVSRPASPLSMTPHHKRGGRGGTGSKSNSKSHGKGSKSRLSNASLLVGLISPPSVHSVGRLLPPHTKLKMARDCCAGLAFLHSKNLMHCDIKSLNFLGMVA